MRPGILRGIISLIIGGVVTGGIYFLLRALTGNPLDWTNAGGATLMFAEVGAAFGWLIGVGGFSRGAASHEGPLVAHLEMEQLPKPPGIVAVTRRNVVNFVKWAAPQIIPNLRSILVAVGVITLIGAGVWFVASNPIVRISGRQTFDANADAGVITGDKFLIFVIVGGVIIGGVVTTAVVLALIFTSLNRQVEVAKKMKVSHLPEESIFYKFGRHLEKLKDFAASWLNDIVQSFNKSVIR
ncbi:MAG: hypothetical protein U0528_11190 [Anaerolineae bacterium]